MTWSNDGLRPRLDVVVPCFNEEKILETTIGKLGQLVRDLRQEQLIADESRLVFVDDGSRDNTWEIIREASESSGVVGIRLTRNAGHQNALLAGIALSTADMVLTIDADLQDDIGVVADMVRKAADGCDVVFGVRANRSADSVFKRWTANGYYRLLRLIGVDVVANHADFRLMTRSAIDRLKQYNEVNLYLRGIVPRIGHRTDSVYYHRLAREAGETKYPLNKMISLAVDGVTSFSAIPLRLIAALGLVVFLASFLMGLWVFWIRLFTQDALPGWASTVLPTFFLGGVQLLCLGVIGEYVAKLYLESKRRPRYFIESISGDLG